MQVLNELLVHTNIENTAQRYIQIYLYVSLPTITYGFNPT